MEIPKENLIQESTNIEKAGKGFGLEVPQSSELEGLKDELGNLEGLINTDSSIVSSDLKKVDSALRQTKVDIGGEIMTLEEVEQIPDLKMNLDEWERIKSGEQKQGINLTRSNLNITKILLKNGENRDWRRLDLDAKVLSDEEFLEISKFNGILFLRGLEKLSDKSAEYLSKYNGTDGANGSSITFSRLREFTDRAADFFAANYKGKISFEGPTIISDYAKEKMKIFRR